MKKTITVNLGGHAFIMDEDAYDSLKRYLNTIESELKHPQDKKEILEDIEIRIAEILKENSQGKKDVVDIVDIEEIIKTMGDPSEFNQSFEENDYSTTFKKNQKRIYRDPDNRVLGGVCGGLGVYFNFDPLILRILFVIGVLFFGTGFFLYIILWIIIPEAKTIAQKLEMRGEPVNISNIGEKIKEEFSNVKKKMNL